MTGFDEIYDFTKEVIHPAVSVDGGDIRLDRVEGNTIIFGAYAECALCPACNDDYIWWLTSRLKDRFGKEFEVRIEKHRPYYNG